MAKLFYVNIVLLVITLHVGGLAKWVDKHPAMHTINLMTITS